MSLWTAILLAAAAAFALKLAGYLVPADLLSHPRAKRVTAALPIALLAALVATQTFTRTGGGLTADARLADLPPITKRAMMNRFDDVVTHPAVTQRAVEDFIADPGRIGRWLHGRYAVWTSSGTTCR